MIKITAKELNKELDDWCKDVSRVLNEKIPQETQDALGADAMGYGTSAIYVDDEGNVTRVDPRKALEADQ